MINTFQLNFTYNISTTDIKFNQASLDNLVSERVARYQGFEIKERINAQILPELINKVIELINEGWTYPDWKSPYSASVGACYIYMVKSPAVQEDDINFIKEKITEAYLAKVEDNYKAEKYRLIQDAVNEARRKDAEEIAKKERTRLDKIERDAVAALEKKLQEAN